jgi:hypothetical protein
MKFARFVFALTSAIAAAGCNRPSKTDLINSYAFELAELEKMSSDAAVTLTALEMTVANDGSNAVRSLTQFASAPHRCRSRPGS